MKYSATTLKLMGKVCSDESEKCQSGPTDGSWEYLLSLISCQ